MVEVQCHDSRTQVAQSVSKRLGPGTRELGAIPVLPRAEALARSRELDAALHRAMRERGELLIDPRQLERAARSVDCCAAATCRRPVSASENLVVDVKRGLVWHAGCR